MDDIQQIQIDNELGKATIACGNGSQRRALMDFDLPLDGYHKLSDEQKQAVDRYAKKLPQMSITLTLWYSAKPNNGFGRYIINKLFDIGERTKTNMFGIFAPSDMAKAVLNHYVATGVLTPTTEGLPEGIESYKNMYFYTMNKRPLSETQKLVKSLLREHLLKNRLTF